jgi:hypothetical protein
VDETPRTLNSNRFFWFGLIGIIASGLMVGAGGDNLWTAAYLNPPFGTEPHVIGRGHLLLVVVVLLVGLFDICALGVIFAGAVVVVQRLKGRM